MKCKPTTFPASTLLLSMPLEATKRRASSPQEQAIYLFQTKALQPAHTHEGQFCSVSLVMREILVK